MADVPVARPRRIEQRGDARLGKGRTRRAFGERERQILPRQRKRMAGLAVSIVAA
jgi:hypothetical protein